MRLSTTRLGRVECDGIKKKVGLLRYLRRLSLCGKGRILSHMFFFFSSRRRHTRWTGDWSSDVCSSDLLSSGGATWISPPSRISNPSSDRSMPMPAMARSGSRVTISSWAAAAFARSNFRSEERRVGKECRSRWWQDERKKKNEEVAKEYV